VNDCDLSAGFSYFYLPIFHYTRDMLLSYRVHIWYKKLGMARLQPGEGRMMIDSVIWAQYINLTDTKTDRQTLQPRRRSKCRANALRRATKLCTKLNISECLRTVHIIMSAILLYGTAQNSNSEKKPTQLRRCLLERRRHQFSSRSY